MNTSVNEKIEETYDVADFVAAEAELQMLKEEHHIEEDISPSLWQKLGDKYVAYTEKKKPVKIQKKKYCVVALLFGWLGMHKFLIGRKGAGILYLLISWTGMSFVLSVLDVFQAVFLKVDENNLITLV